MPREKPEKAIQLSPQIEAALQGLTPLDEALYLLQLEEVKGYLQEQGQRLLKNQPMKAFK